MEEPTRMQRLRQVLEEHLKAIYPALEDDQIEKLAWEAASAAFVTINERAEECGAIQGRHKTCFAVFREPSEVPKIISRMAEGPHGLLEVHRQMQAKFPGAKLRIRYATDADCDCAEDAGGFVPRGKVIPQNTVLELGWDEPASYADLA